MSDSPTLHKRRKKRNPKIRGIILIGVVLVVALCGILLTAPGLKVSSVSCEGMIYLNKEEVLNAADIKTGKNIFLSNTGSAKRKIENLPLVKSAAVKREFPNKIVISIEERTPVAYFQYGSDGVIIDNEAIVVKKVSGDEAEKFVTANTPSFEVGETNGESKNSSDSETATENEDEYDRDEDEDEGIDKEENYEVQNSGEENAEDSKEALIKVPLINGVEIKSATVSRKINPKNQDILEFLLKICNALNKVNLVSRTTYIDISDLNNVKLVVENRLDIRLGSADNIDYRAKFLAEVINTRIAAYEKVIMDYTGNDIYVRSFEDGKKRVEEIKNTKAEDENDDEESDNDDVSEDDDEE